MSFFKKNKLTYMVIPSLTPSLLLPGPRGRAASPPGGPHACLERLQTLFRVYSMVVDTWAASLVPDRVGWERLPDHGAHRGRAGGVWGGGFRTAPCPWAPAPVSSVIQKPLPTHPIRHERGGPCVYHHGIIFYTRNNVCSRSKHVFWPPGVLVGLPGGPEEEEGRGDQGGSPYM